MLVPGLYAKIVFLVILAVMITGANVFLIYIALKSRSLISNSKLFLISLCVAHLFGSLIIIPLWVIIIVNPEFNKTLVMLSQVEFFIWTLMTLTSFYSVSAISVDRFCIISYPMQYSVKATTRRKVFIVVSIWVSCAAITSALMFSRGKPESKFICDLSIGHSLSYALVLLFIGFLTPLLIDSFCCARIIAIAMHLFRAGEAKKDHCSAVSILTSTSAPPSSNILLPHVRLSKLRQKLNSLRFVFASTG